MPFLSFLDAKVRGAFASGNGYTVKRGVGESPSGMRDSQSLDSNVLYNFKRFTNAEASLDPHLDTYPIVIVTKPLLPQFGVDSPRVLAGTSIARVHDRIEKEHFKFLNNRITEELTNSNIIPSYTRMFRSMDIPNLGMNLESTVTNKQKERYIQPTFFTGQNGGTINISMVDDTELTNMKITKAWYDYIKLVTTGRIMPPEMFAFNNIVHYKSSIYILGMSPNFKDIRYFGKFTGVQPSNVPFSSVDFNRENVNVKNFDFEMSYDYFEFLDEELIPDFNTFANILNIRIIKETGTGNYRLEG